MGQEQSRVLDAASGGESMAMEAQSAIDSTPLLNGNRDSEGYGALGEKDAVQASPPARSLSPGPKPKRMGGSGMLTQGTTAKRPGGSGMNVPPQRTRDISPGPRPARVPLWERPLPTLASKQPQKPQQTQTVSMLPEPAEPVVQVPPEVAREELMSKLKNVVRLTSSRSSDRQSALPDDPPATAATFVPSRQETAKLEGWVARVSQSKHDTLLLMKDQLASEVYYEPLTHQAVGDKVEARLGADLGAFVGCQSAIHGLVQAGLRDEMLNEFLFDEESEMQLTTYEKWAAVRQAAEQVLQVPTNRSNSAWIEAESWTKPEVLDANKSVIGSVFENSVDRALSRGDIAFVFIDEGRLCERGPEQGSVSPLLCTDLWAAIKELAPHKVPSSQRLERLSVAGRHLLQCAVSLEIWQGADALHRAKVVVCVDCEQEHSFAEEVIHWSHFGFKEDNLIILPLPRFHGFAEAPGGGRLAHVKNSPKLMMGSGYAMFLLNSPAEAYTLSAQGDPTCLQDSVLGRLQAQKCQWLQVSFLSDISLLMPEAMINPAFLASAIYAAEREGANMAMEVVPGEAERDVRVHDSLVLRRNVVGGGNCSLRASSMRTIKSYQLVQEHTADPTGFHISAQRFAFKLPALKQLLNDATKFHCDVRVHDFYAYASFDLSDITTFREARCACVLGSHRGPSMVDLVFNRGWLTYAAPILEQQDRVAEFRNKAIELVKFELLHRQQTRMSVSISFREKRHRFTAVMFLTLDHRQMAKSALRLARVFIQHLVDRLHLVVVLSPNESQSLAKSLLDELVDKELEFQGQLVRKSIYREGGPKDVTGCEEYIDSVHANMVIVPSVRLCAPSQDLGSFNSSLAVALARNVRDIPVLIVKANSVGKYTSPGYKPASPLAARPGMVVMANLDASVATPVVESIAPFLTPGLDVLYLAKTRAFEGAGHLSMCSRRMFVQARIAGGSLKVEERAYASSANTELPKAIEAELVDLLVVGVPGVSAPSKDIEELLRSARCCIFLNRKNGGTARSSRDGGDQDRSGGI